MPRLVANRVQSTRAAGDAARGAVRARTRSWELIGEDLKSGTRIFLMGVSGSLSERSVLYTVERANATIAVREVKQLRVGEDWVSHSSVTQYLGADGQPGIVAVTENQFDSVPSRPLQTGFRAGVRASLGTLESLLLPSELHASTPNTLFACEQENGWWLAAFVEMLEALEEYQSLVIACALAPGSPACVEAYYAMIALDEALLALGDAEQVLEDCLHRIQNVPTGGGGYVNSEGKWCSTWAVQETLDGGVTWTTIYEIEVCEREYET